jgi:hypothetical protein
LGVTYEHYGRQRIQYHRHKRQRQLRRRTGRRGAAGPATQQVAPARHYGQGLHLYLDHLPALQGQRHVARRRVVEQQVERGRSSQALAQVSFRQLGGLAHQPGYRSRQAEELAQRGIEQAYALRIIY